MTQEPAARDGRPVDVTALAMMFCSIALAVTGQLLMKRGTMLAGGEGGLPGLAAALFSPFVLAGLSSFVVSSMLWLVVWAAYGIVDELLQGLVGRSTDFKDWVADVVGAGIGLGIMVWWERRTHARPSS